MSFGWGEARPRHFQWKKKEMCGLYIIITIYTDDSDGQKNLQNQCIQHWGVRDRRVTVFKASVDKQWDTDSKTKKKTKQNEMKKIKWQKMTDPI